MELLRMLDDQPMIDITAACSILILPSASAPRLHGFLLCSGRPPAPTSIYGGEVGSPLIA